MVNWLVGTTDRFHAAVSENGVANQISDWANSDSGPEYDRASLLGDPLSPEGIDRLWRQSPLGHVANIRTPLLMLQAEADLRCPAQDNEQLFIALRHLGRDRGVRPLPGGIARLRLVRSARPPDRPDDPDARLVRPLPADLSRSAARHGGGQLAGGRPMTGKRGAMQRGRERPTGRTRGKPAHEEAGIERVAGAGRIGRAERSRSPPRIGGPRRHRGRGPWPPWRRASRPQSRRARPGPPGRPRPSSASASAAVANRTSGATSSIRARAARLPPASKRADRGQVDADGRSGGPPSWSADDRRRPGAPGGSRSAGGVRPPRQTMPPAARLGLRSSAAPRSWTKLRSPPGATRTPIRPVRAPAIRATWEVTPSDRTAVTSERPVASRPTAAIRIARAPSLATHRAVLAAEPPCTSATRPGTSLPACSGRAGARTTSSTRSPSTTTLGCLARRGRRMAGISGRIAGSRLQ